MSKASTGRPRRQAKVWRSFLIATVLVAVIAGAAGIGAFTATRSEAEDRPSGQPYVQPKHVDGTTVRYGKASADHTLSVYLDPRCPYCADVENGLGKTMTKLADQGEYRIDYHFATFLDGALGGKGSKRAVNALGAAANESPEKFAEYLGVLYANHPEKETDDKFGSTATLLKLADEVDGLRTPAFNKAVKELTYMPWVEKVSEAFYESGEDGTPVVKLDGKPVEVLSRTGEVMSPEAFAKLVRD
ncbi:thioredoxin domain-containing protein [Streptomyces sp. A7024]|uniref:Thioredoxin domain-containing protein n=1 Tax=Streptomyces coryli TaxID=1128680 RepID=A0A6G4TZI1_9ACTN|nr:thioredoxin domain-containing protein [Streptomyces coryli]NGN65419.1 thioredoxin domain-containing protein [Streptomyces coryli]